MSLMWFASTWIIWKERNDRFFRGKENSPIQLLEKIKILFFWWLKSNFKAFHYNFHLWCQNLFVCVGIGHFLFSYCGQFVYLFFCSFFLAHLVLGAEFLCLCGN